MADEVLDVVEVESQRVSPPPLTLGDANELFVGITEDGALLIDGARMFEVPRFAKAF